MIDIGDVVDYLADVALLAPGIVLTVIVAIGVGARLGRRLGRGRATGMLLVFGLGLIIAATLTPSREALRFGALGSGVCDLSRVRLASFTDVLSLDDAGFNVLLYLPLGLALGWLPARRSSVPWWLLGLVLSPAVELTQLLLRPLDRACQASDVIDNLTGLVIAFAIAGLLQLVAQAGGAPRGGSPDDPPDASPSGSAPGRER